LAIVIDDIPILPPEVQLALYRITQEALNNIDKHAQATRVEVTAKALTNTITLVISDNGIGFDIESTSSTNLGIKIMRERASEINAIIEIDSEPLMGTQIKVVWGKDNQ